MNLILLKIVGGLCILTTILPVLNYQAWWIRVWDFPRLQILFLSTLSLLGILALESQYTFETYLLIGALFTSIVGHIKRIYPYTAFHALQVENSSDRNELNRVSIVVTNVLMTNRQSDRCLQMIDEADPDIVLAVETDKWWENALKPLKEKYPYCSFAPHANTYGLLLFSKLNIEHCEIKYLLDHEIPSIHCTIELLNGEKMKFFGVHPKPPAPQESLTTVNRDAELILVGKEAKQSNKPSIVAGDLNDVAWSHTTHLFQRLTGFKDPRIGRGLFNSFNSKNPLLRWPLDHIFHSDHFRLVNIKRLKHIGSDHFPIYIQLSLTNELSDTTPTPSEEDKLEGQEKINEALRKH